VCTHTAVLECTQLYYIHVLVVLVLYVIAYTTAVVSNYSCNSRWLRTQYGFYPYPGTPYLSGSMRVYIGADDKFSITCTAYLRKLYTSRMFNLIFTDLIQQNAFLLI
jgi:hypothetical protein